MKPCCDTWLLGLEPRSPREGKFHERHQCPTCKTWYSVLFECGAVMGSDELMCGVVGAEEVKIKAP